MSRTMKVLYKIWHCISDAKYWLRTNTYNRYHMVDCRSKQNGYKWGWKDRCELILFANMSILQSFIEKECSPGHVAWDSDDIHINAMKEMRTIYAWWTSIRKVDHDAYDTMLGEAYSGPLVFEPVEDMKGYSRLVHDPELRALRDKAREVEAALEAKDEEMMIRLIKIRHFMWT